MESQKFYDKNNVEIKIGDELESSHGGRQVVVTEILWADDFNQYYLKCPQIVEPKFYTPLFQYMLSEDWIISEKIGELENKEELVV